MKKIIKFSPPDIRIEDIEAVVETLKSGWITTGPKTKLFEKEIANYCGTQKAVTMNSATACLELTLRLLGIGPGDEVITSAYTYTASCSVICHVGAKPVLIDTASNSFEMDYDKLKEAINENTKAIIPVDIGGMICNYEKVFEIIKEKSHLFKPKNEIQKQFLRPIVIADAAHSFGASRNGIRSGNFADFTCFSFHAVKNLTTGGEGGALTWKKNSNISSEEIYKKYMLLSLHGQDKDALAKTKAGAWKYDIVCPGYKCNMTDVSSSIGLSQLKRYENNLEKRRKIVSIYNEAFKNEKFIIPNHISENAVSSCHLYLLRLNGKTESQRNEIIEKMAQMGVATNVHYQPLPLLTAYKNLGFKIENYPEAYKMYENEITLPLHTLLTDEDVEYIINSLKSII